MDEIDRMANEPDGDDEEVGGGGGEGGKGGVDGGEDEDASDDDEEDEDEEGADEDDLDSNSDENDQWKISNRFELLSNLDCVKQPTKMNTIQFSLTFSQFLSFSRDM